MAQTSFFEPEPVDIVTFDGKPGPVVTKRKREGIQLCKVYDPKKTYWAEGGVIYEHKLDGYRCIARVKDGKAETLTSTGLPHWNTTHLIEALEIAAKEFPNICDNIVLDGEITHDILPFDVGGGILRQHDPHASAAGLKLHTWDILPVEEFDTKTCSKELITRKGALATYMDLMWATEGKAHIFEVEYKLGPITDIEKYAKEFVLEDGAEGIVAKWAYGLYEYKKSGVWLKWKPEFSGDDIASMKEGDFRITDIKMGRGKHTGRVGAILIEGYLLEDGNIAPDEVQGETVSKVSGKAGTGFDDIDRIQFMQWFNEGILIGRVVEIKYQELSSKGKVRFPVFYRLRPDKD